MNELEQLEKDLAFVKSHDGRPELLQKLEAQIKRLKDKDNDTDPEITANLEQKFYNSFKSADTEIRSQYIGGTAEYIRKYYPDLDRQISEITKKMHKLWKEGRKGEIRIEDFISILEEWKLLHFKAIGLFKNRE